MSEHYGGAMNGKVLRRLRLERGMSQKDVADAIGTTQAFVYMLEYGHKQPSVETLTALADLFGVSTDTLLGREQVA